MKHKYPINNIIRPEILKLSARLRVSLDKFELNEVKIMNINTDVKYTPISWDIDGNLVTVIVANNVLLSDSGEYTIDYVGGE